MKMTFGTGFAALAVLALSATAPLAKGHDQKNDTSKPGENVFMETVTPAQTLGAGKGASGGTPAADKRQSEH